MRFAPGVVSAVVLSFFVGQSVAAAELEADPSVAPSVEVEQELDAEAARAGDEGFSVHGLSYLIFAVPVDGNKPGLNLFLAQGELRFSNGILGAYATPRLRVAPTGDAQNVQTYLLLQQAYGFVKHDYGEVKVGKVYQHFGRLWDYGVYGPLLANDDLKLQPDLGLSAEGAPEVLPQLNLEYAAQYFPVDGRSFSLRNDRMFSGANVRRRNIVVLRMAPTYHFNDRASLAVGTSGSSFGTVYDKHGVLRGAVDAELSYGPFNAFAEVGRQTAGDVASGNGTVGAHTYVWAGAGYKNSWVHLRYHHNVVFYDQGVADVLYQPGAEFLITENWGAMVEAAFWNSTAQGSATPHKGEKTVYLIASARF